MEDWVSLGMGLIGALIGSGTTILSLWLKENWSYKRDIRKLALEMARTDFEGQGQTYRDRPNFITPLPVLVNYYLKLNDHVEKDTVNADLFKKLAKERHDLAQANIY